MPPCLLPSSPISPILPLVLLSLVPCVLPPFIPPCSSCALVPLSLVLFSPSCLRGHQSIMQNKPNFQNRKTTATTYVTKTYAIIPLLSAPKKQTQSNPIHHGEARLGWPETGSRPPAPLPEIRFTLHDIRPVPIYTCGLGSRPARSRITGVMLSQPMGIRWMPATPLIFLTRSIISRQILMPSSFFSSLSSTPCIRLISSSGMLMPATSVFIYSRALCERTGVRPAMIYAFSCRPSATTISIQFANFSTSKTHWVWMKSAPASTFLASRKALYSNGSAKGFSTAPINSLRSYSFFFSPPQNF